jgi:hypothetical protein
MVFKLSKITVFMDFWAFIVAGCVAFLPWLAHPPSPARETASFSRQQQGLEGIARRKTGNHMPAPQVHPGPGPGVRATICVFPLTNANQVTGAGATGLYSSVHTSLVRQTDTDDSGHFRIFLPPGTYSVFTKKGSLFYATRRDEKNNIAPVEVLPGKMTRVECSVESDHSAIY